MKKNRECFLFLPNEIQMFSHILTLWNNNEHGIIAFVLGHNGLINLVSLNLKAMGLNPLTDDLFNLRNI